MQPDHSDILHLLADESFISYCKKSSPPDVSYWQNYIQQNPQQKELIEQAEQQFLLLFNALAGADLEEQATLLKKKINLQDDARVIKMDERSQSPVKNRSWLVKISISAALVILGLFASKYFETGVEKSMKRFDTNYAERKTIQLPDGSVVSLNAASNIEIDAGFGSNNRDVYLQGEAFFDVKHNKNIPFIVHTAAMSIKALGTAFDVKAYKNETLTETSLIRGSVEVVLKENHNQVYLLHSNEKISWRKDAAGNTNNEPVDTTGKKAGSQDGIPQKLIATNQGDLKEIAWKENKLVFEDDALVDIAVLLERWYGVHIKFDNDEIRNYRFSGVFEKEEIQTVLDILKETRAFNYTIEQGEITSITLNK